MKRLLLATTALALLAGSTTADARPFHFARNGTWNVTYYTYPHRPPMCVLSTTLPGNRTVNIKQVPGGQMFMHLYDPFWSIGPGQQFTIGLSFDNGVALSMNMFGHSDYRIAQSRNGEINQAFTREFMDAHVMTIVFSGSAHPWYVTLRGSETMTYAFYDCVNFITMLNGQPHRRVS